MTQKISPGTIRHGILKALKDRDLSITELSAALTAQKRQFSYATLAGVHLIRLRADDLVDSLDDDKIIGLTADGHSRLRQLDDQLAGGKREDLAPARTYTTNNSIYTGEELKRNPGIPASRYEAFDLPSIQLGHRVWPDGRREKLDDTGR